MKDYSTKNIIVIIRDMIRNLFIILSNSLKALLFVPICGFSLTLMIDLPRYQ